MKVCRGDYEWRGHWNDSGRGLCVSLGVGWKWKMNWLRIPKRKKKKREGRRLIRSFTDKFFL